jgi:hypothetical protein
MFKPNIVKRKKQEPTAPKPERKERKRPERKLETKELVASGPFAMGPAQIKRTVTSSVSSTIVVKQEANYESSDSISDTEMEFANPETEEEEPLMIFQLPKVQISDAAQEKSGKMGRYSIKKDGSMILEIGGITYHVQETLASKTNKVVCIEGDSFIEYGNAKRMICIPQL